MDSRHAYLILAHKNPGQLRKLLEMLDHPQNDIFLHVDSKLASFDASEWENATVSSRLHILDKRMSLSWGGFSIIKCELNLLQEATSAGRYAYYHLISGMELPIKSQEHIHRFFADHAGKEFINQWQLHKSTYSRFRYKCVFPEGEHHFATRLVNHIYKKMQQAVGYSVNQGIEFRYGSQWFSITDALARYTVARRDWVEKVFCRATICDEVFLPTLVANSPFRDNLYDPSTVHTNSEVNMSNARFIDWTRGPSRRHPWVFTAADLPLLESVPHLWARKFDETVDSQIIDLLHQRFKR